MNLGRAPAAARRRYTDAKKCCVRLQQLDLDAVDVNIFRLQKYHHIVMQYFWKQQIDQNVDYLKE